MTTTDVAPNAGTDDEKSRPPLCRTVTGPIRHGGQVVDDAVLGDVPDGRTRIDVTTTSEALTTSNPGHTDFVYLFGTDPQTRLPGDPDAVVASLKALGSAMIEEADGPGADSDVPAIYTYWGQFIDHDLTLNTNSDFPGLDIAEPTPAEPGHVTDTLKNLREPALNLDSVYGSGPGDPVVQYVGQTKLRVGTCTPLNGPSEPILRIPGIPGGPGSGAGDDERDLFRVNQIAQIGDARNDENLIVAQLHVAFLHAHNQIVNRVASTGAADVFGEARRILRWTYQWLVRHDFLPTLVAQEDIEAVEGLPHFGTDGLVMPLEFATAAFRFGHSMVRGSYDWNRNFGRSVGVPTDETRSSFELLFSFTGGGGLGGLPPGPGPSPTLPDNWPAEWERLVGGQDTPKDQNARKIDTNLALPLDGMIKEGNDAASVQIREMLKRLAVRNLLRGYKLALPTGQAVAQAYGVPPLSPEQILGSGRIVKRALVDGGFVDTTPLWFYVLREAEVRADGQRLGPVGGRIVAETLIGELKNDPESYLVQAPNWDPGQEPIFSGANAFQITEIADLLRLAGVLAPR